MPLSPKPGVTGLGQGKPPDADVSVNWPKVPACYGWLSLDRRGGWRLKGEVIRHTGLIAAINRNYAPDANGNWIFRNGPQAVFVTLDYTPLVLRLELDRFLVLHTGHPAGMPAASYLDEDGNVLLAVDSGIGLLDDRDLAVFMAQCIGPDGAAATEEEFHAAMLGTTSLTWQGLGLQTTRRKEVASRFGFNPLPQPGQHAS